ncbi:D-sedoheptulose-7-phosphate isomerase [Sphaerisporangium corydalis]|uniref:SIS domain-containing protein n=1 Tax=Sphaerisporangium corydalis TaxID=1441875 RepID=A0ABV9E9R9_9ACTN|nr:SIS domain-containing protein [Sphaerisporangium corydalis]
MDDDPASEGIHRLYPFLDAGHAVRAAHPELAEERDAATRDAAHAGHVNRSTEVKAEEIVRLRARVAELYTDRIAECAEAMAARFASGGRLFTFGNGGSSTDAQEVATAFLHPSRGRPLPALSLTSDAALVTALSNDVGFDVVFARQVSALARPGDIALGLSTSGGSANLVQAFEEAWGRGLLTIGLAGYQGGRLAELAELDVLDYLFVVPSSSVHRIQEAQTTIYHVLWEATQHVLGTVPGLRGRHAG